MTHKIVRITTVPISLKLLLKGQLQYFNNFFSVVAISSPLAELKEVELQEGVQTIGISMTRVISPFADFLSLIKMCLVLKKEKPRIVHTHTPKAGLIGMLASFLVGVPVRLHTVAGLPLMESKGAKKKLLLFVERIIYRCATRVYPNSAGLYQYILQNKITTKEKLKVIGKGSSNGIDVSFFSKEALEQIDIVSVQLECKIKSTDFIFIFIGRLVTDKGINELVSAFNSSDFQDAKLLLIGSYETDLDPLQNDTLAIIQNNPSILHLGFKKDVRPYLAIANCLVFPSYREGFPNVVMQAGSMGLPCIVSDINGCNEIIIHDQNGIIVKPKNITDLVRAMSKLYNDRDLLGKMSKYTRDLIVSRYSQEYFWDELHKEYAEFIS